ncbi:uncharacterized protein LOC133196350 [Saccostrea echinata]|uniref:uncharacterized protein LOC133196350 n=1 Tax=Saccostrea echinata TaxID=191078 RepID=UPI002A7F6B15|nr:uncharacterized protein LOC133196350 [Saccostrea echinata]
MGTKELLLSAGVPNDFGETLRSKNGMYKATTYEPSNKNKPYQPKKCSTPKPYEGHTYKHTIKPVRESRVYEPHTYDHVYVMSKIYHEKPKKENTKKATTPPPQKPKTPPSRQPSPPLPYSAVETIRRSNLLAQVSTASPEHSYSVFS